MTLSDYLQLPFVQNALLVGVLVALCSSLLGTPLVLKRFSFIGDGLSHVAFGAMAVAAVVGLTNDMFLVLPVTILCAVILLAAGTKAKIKGDAAVAMISVGALAVGYLLMNLYPPSGKANISGDVCTTLFGGTSILTLKSAEVWMSIALSVVVVLFFVLFYHKIFAVTFDESFATATGINAKLYNLLIAVIIAVVIVLAMNLVGSLLISALVVFPALSAMRIFKKFRSVTICAAVISVICAVVGILLSAMIGTPVGSTIVAANILTFINFSFIAWVNNNADSAGDEVERSSEANAIPVVRAIGSSRLFAVTVLLSIGLLTIRILTVIDLARTETLLASLQAQMQISGLVQRIAYAAAFNLGGLILIGLLLIYSSSRQMAALRTTGFRFIKPVLMIYLILAFNCLILLLMLFVHTVLMLLRGQEVPLWSETVGRSLSDVFGITGAWRSLLLLPLPLAISAACLIVAFLSSLIRTVNRIMRSVRTDLPDDRVSLFLIVFLFALSAGKLLILLFNHSADRIVSAVAFGAVDFIFAVLLLQYRRKMREIRARDGSSTNESSEC